MADSVSYIHNARDLNDMVSKTSIQHSDRNVTVVTGCCYAKIVFVRFE